MSLRLKGVFEKISGLIVGYNFNSDDPEVEGNERTLKEIVLETTENYTFPIMQIGEIGHYVENLILPLGAKASMDATNPTLSIDRPVVI